jgi:hypothetical protein
MMDLSKRQIGMSVASGAVMIGTALPWLSAPIIGSVPGYRGDGKYALIAGAVVLLVVLLSDTMDIPTAVQKWTSVGMGVVATAIPASSWYALESHVSEMADSDNPFSGALSASVGAGVGLIITLAAGIALIVVPMVIDDDSKEHEPDRELRDEDIGH